MIQNNRPQPQPTTDAEQALFAQLDDVLNGDLAHYAEETMSRSEIRAQPSDGGKP